MHLKEIHEQCRTGVSSPEVLLAALILEVITMAKTIDDLQQQVTDQGAALTAAEGRISALQAGEPDPAKLQAVSDGIAANTARINAIGTPPASAPSDGANQPAAG